MVICGRDNSRIKQLRRLRSRNRREQTGLFFIEGVRLVAEAVQMGAEIVELIVSPELLVSPFGQALAAQQQRAGTPCLEVTPAVFETLADKNVTQGIGAAVRQRWEALDDVRLANERSWVGVEAIRNPGNLGTILRTHAAVDGAGVILIGATTDPYDPSAVRASLGAIFSQRLVRTTIEEFSAWKQRHRPLVVGTSPGACTDYQEISYRPPLVLLMGSERQGLSAEVQALCDVTLRIPMAGRCDSLNVAVATSLVLYEMFNQRRLRPQPEGSPRRIIPADG